MHKIYGIGLAALLIGNALLLDTASANGNNMQRGNGEVRGSRGGGTGIAPGTGWVNGWLAMPSGLGPVQRQWYIYHITPPNVIRPGTFSTDGRTRDCCR
jgi:hypothetical protein